LDLKDNQLITRTALGTVTNLIIAGRNGGSWNGNGIITSMTAAKMSASPLTTLAVAANSVLNKSSFGNQSVGSSDVLVMYTYAGDMNLNGDIDGDDYFRIDQGFQSGGSLTGYVNGDLNYDGKINADDYFLIDRNYSRQGTAFSVAPALGGVSAVPEPAVVGLLGLYCGGRLLMRRSRRV
jgi:hypothetical protein